MNAEKGFSLVEVVVAMMILTVGVLGLAASAAAVGNLTAEGSRMAKAANAASSKFEELRASSTCSTMASGTDTWSGGFTRRWTVATSGLVQTVTLQVSYSNGRKTRTTTYVSEISCAPTV